MNFSDLIQAKLEARRRGEAPIQATAAVLREQALDRIRPIYDAVEKMVIYMAEDPLFAAVFDTSPKIEFQHEAPSSTTSSILVEGKAAFFLINVHQREGMGRDPWTELTLQIAPDVDIMTAVGGGHTYASANEIKADARDIAGFLLMVEDMIAELLADIAVSEVGEKYFKRRPDSY